MRLGVLLALVPALIGCRGDERPAAVDTSSAPEPPRPGATVAVVGTPGGGATGASSSPSEPPTPTSLHPGAVAVATSGAASKSQRIVILAGGDVDYGRMRGARLVREPERNDFAPFGELFAGANLRFINLESTISEFYGQTTKPEHKLVFTAPVLAAAALARADIDIVSLANNHAWDYGEAGLLQTLAHLDRVRIAHAGAGRTKDEAYAPRIVEVAGWRVAFVAVTSAWNQQWEPHPGKERIADAVSESLCASVRNAREFGADRVIVSHHGGEEYVPEPRDGTRALAQAVIEAGADAFIGHHPHVVQRVALIQGRPVFYSLGNMLMRMVTGKPWTEYGILARLTLDDGALGVEVCPFRLSGLDPVPLARDSQRAGHEAHFRATFERLLAAAARAPGETALRLEPLGADGCGALTTRP